MLDRVDDFLHAPWDGLTLHGPKGLLNLVMLVLVTATTFGASIGGGFVALMGGIAVLDEPFTQERPWSWALLVVACAVAASFPHSPLAGPEALPLILGCGFLGWSRSGPTRTLSWLLAGTLLAHWGGALLVAG